MMDQADGPAEQETHPVEESGCLTTERRMSRELWVKLETLKLKPAQQTEVGETSQKTDSQCVQTSK